MTYTERLIEEGGGPFKDLIERGYGLLGSASKSNVEGIVALLESVGEGIEIEVHDLAYTSRGILFENRCTMFSRKKKQ